jgi:imidazolonepropionase-like amidohydrolase
VQVLPGSGNLVGGQGFVMKLRDSFLIEELTFAGARRTLKMAVGENPKRVYGNRNQMPSTRMGNAAALRQALTDAAAYRDKRARHAAKSAAAQASGTEAPEPMEFDAKLDVLADLLERKIDAHIHCYRQDELLALLALSREFGFTIAAFHHGLEAYKVADEIAAAGVGVCTWPDWWGYKIEMWDGIPWNGEILSAHGVRVAVHSDSANTVQRLYHEAAKMVMYGADEDEALRMITIHPAWMLGVDRKTGTLEPGKDADIAVFTHHPFDIYTRVALTLIDGRVVYRLTDDGGGR